MRKAKDLIAERMEMKEILITHDVHRFREFIEKNQEVVEDLGVIHQLMAYDDLTMSEMMHALKCTEPYLGEAFQASRNYFRRKQLHAEEAPEFTPDLKAYLHSKATEPLCYQCKYFREAPPGEEVPCMQMLPQPSMPADIACPGFTLAGESDVSH